MKILYIGDPGTVGGASLSFVEVVLQMKKRGVSVIVCTSFNNDYNKHLKELGIENIAIGHDAVLEPTSPYWWKRPIKYPVRWLLYRIHLRRALKRIEKNVNLETIDIIHTNSARNDVGCFINKKYRIPHIMHIREFADADFNCITYRKGYISIFNEYTTKFIAISEAVKKHWIKKGIEENKIIRIYNGVSHEDIPMSILDDKMLKDLHMIMTGGICEPKGQHLVIEAMNMLPLEIKRHIYVDFAGWDDPRYLSRLKELVDVYELVDNVNFLGAVPHVATSLGKYQVGLMCSVSEGFGRVTAEYMFAKLGIIASNSGANPELIDDGVNGLLFESGNASSLSVCMEKLYQNRQLLISCAEKAHEKACNEYTDEKNVDQIYQLYLDVIQR